jgi:16S rRNA G966 N2-methylase RsmD
MRLPRRFFPYHRTRGAAGAGSNRKRCPSSSPWALAAFGRQFDVVYLDPPYASDLYEPLIQLSGERLLAQGGVVVAEHFHKRALPERIGALVRTRLKRVGDHCLSFYSRGGERDTE